MGAGLLAKRLCHSTFMSTDTPLSRASPLPHCFVQLKNPAIDLCTSELEAPHHALQRVGQLRQLVTRRAGLIGSRCGTD
ncbi:hypothetical protein C1894_28545 [Pseudomonas sp. FW305-3-2-15-E-TSA2]|nr:hypothetical protein C1895_03615 [Pseudomonas sp. FW305-3-2-15-E-TSA4]POA31209.1 hypothetical protein C1894_28545 [Pseudomonas sp. FW305-3-2-15-E-TSA2]